MAQYSECAHGSEEFNSKAALGRLHWRYAYAAVADPTSGSICNIVESLEDVNCVR